MNRARYMPQQCNLIATKTISGEVHIFDYFKHIPKTESHTHSKPEAHPHPKPELKLIGHEYEGYGLSWNPQQKGYLVSGSDDRRICLWDIEGTVHTSSTIEPIRKYDYHSKVVQDVSWHKVYSHLFASVGDDQQICLWDIRSDNPTPIQIANSHSGEILCIDFCPYDENCLAIGCSDHSVSIWDIRKFSSKERTLVRHKSEVASVSWSPTRERILVSADQDRKIVLWDVGQMIGNEMLFVHEGHTNRINDVGWSPIEDRLIASTAEDNIIQLWQLGDEIFNA